LFSGPGPPRGLEPKTTNKEIGRMSIVWTKASSGVGQIVSILKVSINNGFDAIDKDNAIPENLRVALVIVGIQVSTEYV